MSPAIKGGVKMLRKWRETSFKGPDRVTVKLNRLALGVKKGSFWTEEKG